MIDPGKESRVGCAIVAGIPLILCGLVLTLIMFGGGAGRLAVSQGSDPSMLLFAGLGIGLAVLGALLVIGGLYGGIRVARKSTVSTKHSEEGCQVLARFMMNKRGEMVFDPEFADFDVRYMVQLMFQDGRKGEYRCAAQTFSQCGEGMSGTAYLEGDWLGMFEPALKPSG